MDPRRNIQRRSRQYPRKLSLLVWNNAPGLGPLSPSPDNVAQALAREIGSRVQIAGARAASVLGLCTQVPARSTYLADGLLVALLWICVTPPRSI
ncbi:hypothetical protein X735_23030 [Mesorhizobium sp. L2C085B000]|nr:hypothetical protein X735_23030 [Mesorhizobium sp. L2C085B000]